MSNILNNTTAITAITKAWSDKLGDEDKSAKAFAKQMDIVKQHMRWTDAVSPTKGNVASGKTTASKESYEELKACFVAVHKAAKRDHGSTVISSVIKDLKNELMKRHDPELYAATKGNMKLIESVDVSGNATLTEQPKDDADKTEAEKHADVITKRDTQFTNLKNWVEKNDVTLGEDYALTRKAILTAMETLSIKR